MNPRTLAVLLLPLLAVLLTAPLGAQDWQQQLTHQLDALDTQFATNGFVATEVQTGLVEAGRSETVSLILEPGSYMVAAVCDNDCSDVDLAVDHAGITLDRDVLEDDVPIVDFVVDRRGSYSFTISMVSCSTPTCGYGLGVYMQTGAGMPMEEMEGMEDLEIWQQQLARQLLALDNQLGSEGYVGTDFEFGLIAANSSDHVTLSFDPGSYMAAAVCDNDCTDVDLVLYDMAGNTLDEDVLLDDAPIVEFRGPGKYEFEVRMIDCSTPTCGWALRVYRQD